VPAVEKRATSGRMHLCSARRIPAALFVLKPYLLHFVISAQSTPACHDPGMQMKALPTPESPSSAIAAAQTLSPAQMVIQHITVVNVATGAKLLRSGEDNGRVVHAATVTQFATKHRARRSVPPPAPAPLQARLAGAGLQCVRRGSAPAGVPMPGAPAPSAHLSSLLPQRAQQALPVVPLRTLTPNPSTYLHARGRRCPVHATLCSFPDLIKP